MPIRWEASNYLHVGVGSCKRPDDYMLPLVEKVHPTQANKITWMLEGVNNYEIANMIGYPELLHTRVEAGHKPETLKMFYNKNNKNKNNNNSNKKKKNKKK
ncbi:embryonic polyadenylate-binding protein-like [Ictalurus furcatus]|uniref:embryonic polyadenylate-binding protein-like n=1 Tax=Ictalurus furcatus TaxID=66913 RepID=UPI00234FB696|nr:embryonic polyadenylate-binding protein-like [Ictalurus furcatus]